MTNPDPVTPEPSETPASEPEPAAEPAILATSQPGTREEPEAIVMVFTKWRTEWKPYPYYLTLAQVKDKIGDRDLVEVLVQCQCIGHTMHVEREIPPEAWTAPEWKWSVEENQCGRSMYSDHLQFQVQVFEPDVDAVLDPAPGSASRMQFDDADGPPEVEVVEGFEGLPGGWGMRTLEGLAWQTFRVAGPECGPMRTAATMAVADAWSFQTASKWA